MSEQTSILIVDDEKGMRETVSEIFQKKGYSTEVSPDGKTAIDIIKKEFFNIVILDMRLPDMSGVEVLTAIKEESPDTEVVIITAFASLQTSVEALNKGAFAYLMKPFEINSLARTVASAAERQRLILENRSLRRFNENIIQSLTEGILIEDEKGLISFVNPALEKLFERPKEEIIGRPFNDFIAPESQDTKCDKKPYAKGGQYAAEMVTKNNKIIPVVISAVSMFENDVLSGVLSVLTDISNVKRLEEELKEKLEELERFNKLMVGRELKMVELKERIKTLEKELERLGYDYSGLK